MYFFDSGFILLVLPAFAFALYAQNRVASTYARFSRQYSSSRMTGGQIARILLDEAGMEHIPVEITPGHLTDHYDPRAKVVRLSSEIFQNNSIAARGIAAHEVGHAIQHDTAYLPLGIRNAIFPLAGFGSRAALPLFFIGFLFSGGLGFLMDVGIALFLFAVIFQTITLPVELNASNRALALLEGSGYLKGAELEGAGQVLRAAALTYVAALAVALAQLFRLFILRGRE